MSYCRGPGHPYVVGCVVYDDAGNVDEKKTSYECLGCDIATESAHFNPIIHKWCRFPGDFITNDPLVMYNHLQLHLKFSKDKPPKYAMRRLFREACDETTNLLETP